MQKFHRVLKRKPQVISALTKKLASDYASLAGANQSKYLFLSVNQLAMHRKNVQNRVITSGSLIPHKYRGSCVAFSISKSVEPNEELKVG
jgi:hypothetical protein